MVNVIKTASEIPSQGLVVIDFSATWCGPCQRIAPIYEQLSEKFSTITFLKADVDESEELAGEYSVMSLPTFVFMKDGVLVNRIEGANVTAIGEALSMLEG